MQGTHYNAWLFLLTVRRNPYLASLVRSLNVGNWGFCPYPQKHVALINSLPGPKCTYAGVKAHISQPDALRCFTFYGWDGSALGNRKIANIELWTCLREYGKNLGRD